jgi:hypothetical protein
MAMPCHRERELSAPLQPWDSLGPQKQQHFLGAKGIRSKVERLSMSLLSSEHL